ncbi:MAG: hypothetical protein ACTHKQ_01405 [Mesorhizobium sp.]|jgi:hypothetical protein
MAVGDMETDRTSAAGLDAARLSAEGQVAGLADILVASLDALARSGQADAACREAGRACAVLRGANPAQWRKFNALLHRLSRHVRCD